MQIFFKINTGEIMWKHKAPLMYTQLDENRIHIEKAIHDDKEQNTVLVAKALPAGSHESRSVWSWCHLGEASLQTATSSSLQGKQIYRGINCLISCHVTYMSK
jgi:hypothetical protein